ncbi:glycosyltransferase family 4 protein, partial [Thermodesulfobacteriota bacterium]
LHEIGFFSVSVTSPTDGPMTHKYSEHGIPVIIHNTDKCISNLENWLPDIDFMANILKAKEYDLVVANTLRNFFWINIAHRAGIPSILIPRESEPPRSYFDYLPSKIRRFAFQSFDLATRVIFVANATKIQWEFKNQNDKFRLIYNALRIDPIEKVNAGRCKIMARKAMGIKDDEVVILSIGTVSPRKGQKDLVQALPLIFEKAENPIKTYIVGCSYNKKDQKISGYNKEIHSMYDAYLDDFKQNTFLYPETDKINGDSPFDFYLIADIFIFTSRFESYPRVILEAMYFGLPIVTTPCFGVKEQCIEGENALFYNPGNIQELTEKVTKVINEPQLRERFSSNSKLLFKQMHSYHYMVGEYNKEILRIFNI